MITLNKIASQIIRKLSGGDRSKDSPIERRDVVLRIRQVMAELLKLELYEYRNAGDRLPPGLYIATYSDLTITKDTDTEEKYVTLPEHFMSLPYNKGIYRVAFSGSEVSMIRRNNPYVSNVLPSASLEGHQGYYVEGFRLYLDNPEEINETKKKVTAKLLVPAPDSIGKDDSLPILPEHQAEIIRRVVNDMFSVAIEDKLNDEVGTPSIAPTTKQRLQ